ncbi:hypothetical protein CYMTET_20146 [Cymbomonas tetramitiformis]|uniref:Uncharacterized protein n=1 Tax=Cymbomonas tetramitiformis TaxID=36881 RepID=A0AAE0G546_9CHLO|nr:hypothetical protein CYMTET_20146 [Cymbomonas tetramitiformis]
MWVNIDAGQSNQDTIYILYLLDARYGEPNGMVSNRLPSAATHRSAGAETPFTAPAAPSRSSMRAQPKRAAPIASFTSCSRQGFEGV